MTEATDNKAARCIACGKYKAYRQDLCWGRHNAVERFASELNNTSAESATEDHKDEIP